MVVGRCLTALLKLFPQAFEASRAQVVAFMPTTNGFASSSMRHGIADWVPDSFVDPRVVYCGFGRVSSRDPVPKSLLVAGPSIAANLRPIPKHLH